MKELSGELSIQYSNQFKLTLKRWLRLFIYFSLFATGNYLW